MKTAPMKSATQNSYGETYKYLNGLKKLLRLLETYKNADINIYIYYCVNAILYEKKRFVFSSKTDKFESLMNSYILIFAHRYAKLGYTL